MVQSDSLSSVKTQINAEVTSKPERHGGGIWLVSPKMHNQVLIYGGLEQWQNTENSAEQQAREKLY